MSDLTKALAKVEGEHATALNWFREHAGKVVSWSTIQDHENKGARLVTQVKRIYKPGYTAYALSVRQTLNSLYVAKDVIRRPNGSWVYAYFQDNPDPAERDREVTNRGLLKCMDDGVPVGVLIQVKSKPSIQYSILGLALVAEWKDGYFILEGFTGQGGLKATMAEPDAAYDRARASAAPAVVEYFNPAEAADRRDRQIAEVIRRRGQIKFRADLIAAYDGKCVISGCNAVDALEAVHISPDPGAHTNHVQNGLLLRADLHSLFDLGLLAIDPSTMTVAIAAELSTTSYAEFAGTSVSSPIDASYKPSAEALAQHLKWTGIIPPSRRT